MRRWATRTGKSPQAAMTPLPPQFACLGAGWGLFRPAVVAAPACPRTARTRTTYDPNITETGGEVVHFGRKDEVQTMECGGWGGTRRRYQCTPPLTACLAPRRNDRRTSAHLVPTPHKKHTQPPHSPHTSWRLDTTGECRGEGADASEQNRCVGREWRARQQVVGHREFGHWTERLTSDARRRTWPAMPQKQRSVPRPPQSGCSPSPPETAP
jgi:hypothetical protein